MKLNDSKLIFAISKVKAALNDYIATGVRKIP